MPQFSVKLITYDPVIIEAFERLRKGRKLAAFTHEAIKYFLTSDRGRKVIELMSNYNLSHLHLGHDIIKVELPKKPVPAEFNFPSEMATVSFSDVMENILK